MHLERRLVPHGKYSSKEFEKQLARDCLFECIQTLETRKQMRATPIADLRRKVYPLFAELQNKDEVDAAIERGGRLFTALTKWLADFNLTVIQGNKRVPAPWAFRKALLTLFTWHGCGLSDRWAGGAIYSEFAFAALRSAQNRGEYRLTFVGQKPGPLVETFREFKARVRLQLEPYLKKEWDEAVAALDVPDPAEWHAKRQDAHFSWLCLFQLGGSTYEEIAEACQGADGLDVTTIRRGVRAAASMVGLAPRPQRRGPARKTSGVSA
jgi:hypothetical protein